MTSPFPVALADPHSLLHFLAHNPQILYAAALMKSGLTALLFVLLLPHCGSETSAPSQPSSSIPPSVTNSAPNLSASALPSATASARLAPVPAENLVYGKHRRVWIYQRPSTSSPWLGYLGIAGSLALADTSPVPGQGCSSFYPVKPRGYVCVDGKKATLDPLDKGLLALSRIAPKRDENWLHEYGEAKQTPRYFKFPSAKQQDESEFRLADHLKTIKQLQEGTYHGDLPLLLQGVDPRPAGEKEMSFVADIPRTYESRNHAPAGSGLSWNYSFDAEGRSWLVAGDGALMPKDRVAPYPRRTFAGVELRGDLKLPLAFIRESPRPKYLRSDAGEFTASAEQWPRLARLSLTGQSLERGKNKYWETSESGFWVKERDASVLRPSGLTPWGDPIDAPSAVDKIRWPNRAVPGKGGRSTWVEVSVHQGWMIAYEGSRPVYATLMASGRGEKIGDFVQSATPDGVFQISGKYLLSTMDIGALVHFDVPYAMPFHNAYAFHAAYWHDNWGEKVSMGCVNLSPIDAKWLFRWAEPSIPEGWDGMKFDSSTGYATVVVIHG